MNRQKFETVMDIYENNDDFRTVRNTNQPLRQTGSECVRNRNYRAVTLCLVLLCVLLLTAVIVLCVLINTKKCLFQNLTEERDQLLKSKNGWIYYESSLYFISSEQKSWSDSRRYCREKEADLVIIDNTEEQGFIRSISGREYIWIGLSDSDVEGSWKWVDGSTLTSSFWRSNEPNNEGGDEDCVETDSSGWNDASCNKKLKWICEKSIFK